MKTILTFTIFIVVFGTNMFAHVNHVIHEDGNRLLLYYLVLGLSCVYDAYVVWSVRKRLTHSLYDEVLSYAMVLFVAAVFADLLTENWIAFGLYSFAGFLGHILIKRIF